MNKLSIEELKEMRAYATARHLERFVRVIDEAVAIRELEGEQVPVGITDDMAMAFHAATTDSALGRDDMEEIKVGLQAVRELFTAPQKPVVLPKSFVMVKLGPNAPEIKCYSEQSVIAAIEAAGGIVKDGE